MSLITEADLAAPAQGSDDALFWERAVILHDRQASEYMAAIIIPERFDGMVRKDVAIAVPSVGKIP